jgi:hypothetical protein
MLGLVKFDRLESLVFQRRQLGHLVNERAEKGISPEEGTRSPKLFYRGNERVLSARLNFHGCSSQKAKSYPLNCHASSFGEQGNGV